MKETKERFFPDENEESRLDTHMSTVGGKRRDLLNNKMPSAVAHSKKANPRPRADSMSRQDKARFTLYWVIPSVVVLLISIIGLTVWIKGQSSFFHENKVANEVKGENSIVPQFDFAMSWGSSASDSSSSAHDVVSDSSNNAYVLGSYMGSEVDIDPGIGVQLLPYTANWNQYVVKYSSVGDLLWGYTIPVSASPAMVHIAITSNEVSIAFPCPNVEGSLIDMDITGDGIDSRMCNGFGLITLGVGGNYIRGISLDSAVAGGYLYIEDALYTNEGTLKILGNYWGGGTIDYDFTEGTDAVTTTYSSEFILSVTDTGSYGGSWHWDFAWSDNFVAVESFSIDDAGNITIEGLLVGTVDLSVIGGSGTQSQIDSATVCLLSLDSSENFRWFVRSASIIFN